MNRNGLKISLAIPFYNAGSFIQQALDSIDLQTVTPDEIIVIDDGSTDGSIRKIESRPGLRLLRHRENMGIAAARNSIIAAAAGDIIVFMDADGIADPQFIENLLSCYSDINVAGAGGKGVESIQNSLYDRWRKEVLFQHWGNSPINNVPFIFGICSSYRKDILQKMHGFGQNYRSSGEDMDMGFRLQKAGYRLAYSPEAIVFHQRSDNQQSIKDMTYRHCFYGFLAQRRNNNFSNKVSTKKSIFLYLKHILYDGLLKWNFPYALLSTKLHLIIVKAWFDAGRHHKTNNETSEKVVWEGHCSNR